ncbi:hypothetical protein G7046_g8323 [Stylonectria norvegica]|nr:hypothetical protein G7046_g8323 [Stylonectria norvegica]
MYSLPQEVQQEDYPLKRPPQRADTALSRACSYSPVSSSCDASNYNFAGRLQYMHFVLSIQHGDALFQPASMASEAPSLGPFNSIRQLRIPRCCRRSQPYPDPQDYCNFPLQSDSEHGQPRPGTRTSPGGLRCFPARPLSWTSADDGWNASFASYGNGSLHVPFAATTSGVSNYFQKHQKNSVGLPACTKCVRFHQSFASTRWGGRQIPDPA